MEYDLLKYHVDVCGCHEQLGPYGTGWGIEQNPYELATFLSSIELPKTVLELGTGYRAGMARFLTEILGCQVITVNLFQPATPAPLARQVIGRTADIVEQVRGEYDLVIIDADHSYESVREDFERFYPMAKVVMIHDIAGYRDCEGAHQFWWEIAYNELRELKPGYYNVLDDNGYGAGIGWIVKSELITEVAAQAVVPAAKPKRRSSK